MKKLIALILVCVLCAASAYAAEWAEGLSPSKPMESKPEIDLTKKFGYWILYPAYANEKMHAKRFCDVLEIYMPDPGVALGEGTAALWNADGKVCTMDFSNPDQVELRQMEETELNWLRWGSGVCVTIHLPISMKIGEEYYVTMDKGALTTNNGKVLCQPMIYYEKASTTEQYWSPYLEDDFGISSLYYSAPAGEFEDDEEEDKTPEPKYNPVKGDTINFDVVVGGDAVAAVMISENDSVQFDIVQCTETTHVTGTIVGDDMNWGVVFVDANDEPIDFVSLF